MSTYSKYRSPIQLLMDFGLRASDIGAETLQREQAKFLHALNSSNEESFRIGSEIYTRGDLIEFTQTLDPAIDIQFHKLIFETPALSDLLGNHVISGNKQEEYRARADFGGDRQKFGEYISPFLAFAINHLFTSAIKQSNYIELNKLSPLFKFLSEEDGMYAFRKLKEWSTSLDQRLNDPGIVRFEFPAERYIHFCYSPFYNLVNAASQFYPELPDTVGDALTVFALSYKRSRNREDNLLKISNQLKKLNCSERSRQAILNNHTQFISDTKESGKGGNAGMWIMVGSTVVVLSVVLIYLFRDRSDSSGSQIPNSYQNSQPRRYVSTTPSPSRVLESGFDQNAFRLFHDHTFACVVQKDFEDNAFVWDGIPDIKSPLTVVDSATMQPKGKRVSLSNKTDSEVLMVVRDENSLSTHYVDANSEIRLHLDPNSLIFFYSGKAWTEEESIVYDHPYQNIMTDSWTVRYTGRFKTTEAIDLKFLKKMYVLKKGSVSDLQIVEEGGEYVFRGEKYGIPLI